MKTATALQLVAAVIVVSSYEIPLGIIYDGPNQAEVSDAIRLALDIQNAKTLYLKLEPRQLNFLPPRKNAFYLERDVCELMSDGIFSLFGSGQYETYAVLNAMSDTFRLPFFNWNSRQLFVDENKELIVDLRPPLYELMSDVIARKQWKSISYLYHGREAISNLQRVNDILTRKYNYSISAELFRIDFNNDLFLFLHSFQSRRATGAQHVIVDIGESSFQNKFVSALATLATRTRNFHYFIANFDLTAKQLNRFKVGMMNITGFKIIDKDAKNYRSFLPLWKKHYGLEDMSPEAAFAFDSVHVFVQAMDLLMNTSNYKLLSANFRGGKMYNRNRPGLSCDASANGGIDDVTTTFEHGIAIAKAAKAVQHNGLSGNIEFDNSGIRRHFRVEVVELLFSGLGNMISISTTSTNSWTEGRGFHHDLKTTDERPFINTQPSERVNIITTILSEPFVMLKKQRDGEILSGNDRYEGFCVDLMRLLANKMPAFRYQIKLVNDSRYGNVGKNGVWDGMIGELLRKEADFAIASLTITKARERVVDFSKPFLTLGISIMIKKPDKQEFSVFSFMSPLSPEIWMYIAFAYFAVSLVIFLVSRFSPYEWQIEETASGFRLCNSFSVYNCLWFTLAAFMQQGTDILPRSASARIASSAWWFFTMILVSSYTANLAAFLTLEKMQTPIESVEDLARQTKIKYGIQGGGSTAEFFRSSSVETYQRMWQYMESQVPSVFAKDYAEGIRRVRESKGRYAFLLESTANDYMNTRKPCDTMKVGNNLNSVGYGVATPFGSEYRDAINLAILELQEKGELKKLENKWWYDRGQCEPGSQDSQSSSLNLSKVAGIFYILIVGMVTAMVIAMIEFVYRSRAEARKHSRSLGSALRSHFEILLKGANPADHNFFSSTKYNELKE